MKFDRIPTRRKPVKKTFYARLFNKPKKPRKQRASAAASSPEEIEGPGINISRSLSIIFAIHIVAIGMIFIHKQYLSGRTPSPPNSENTSSANIGPSSPTVNNTLPVLSSGDKPYMVEKGDNYTIIARKFQVDESELRTLNRGADIRAGVVLRIPQGKRIVAEAHPEVASIQRQQPENNSERGLVEILPSVGASEAQVIRPTTRQLEDAPRAEPVSSNRTHTVVSGESIWRVSNQYGVSQKELMELNNISDPTKLKIGQLLKLP
jgi:LysM repeat protein